MNANQTIPTGEIQAETYPTWAHSGVGHSWLTQGGTSIDAAWEEAGLGWEVEKRPSYRPDNSGTLVRVEDRFEIIRKDTDEVLSAHNVTKSYRILQLEDARRTLSRAFEVAGVEPRVGFVAELHGGAKVAIGFILPGGYTVRCKDNARPHTPMVLDLFGHTGKDGYQRSFGNSALWCWNQTPSLKAEGFSIRHNESALPRLEEAGRLMLEGHRAVLAEGELMQSLADRSLAPSQFQTLAEAIGFDVPLDELPEGHAGWRHLEVAVRDERQQRTARATREELRGDGCGKAEAAAQRYYDRFMAGNEGAGWTYYGALQAVTAEIDRQDAGEGSRPEDARKRARQASRYAASALVGTGAARKRAVALALPRLAAVSA